LGARAAAAAASKPRVVKLIIQIPCFNEAATLPQTVHDLPRSVAGIDTIELLVVDDGSTDGTSEVARKLGVHHVIRFEANRGLARAFAAGLDASTKLGADIIVNTDGDNQYRGEDVARLVQPIVDRTANIVIGVRDMRQIAEFSAWKKFLQRAGSYVVSAIARTPVPDTTSGFRAFDSEAALRLNVLSEFTYTLETIIQADACRLRVACVPIRTNSASRRSRLFSSATQYIGRSVVTILRTYAMYRPLRILSIVAGIFFAAAAILLGRFVYFYFALGPEPTGHIQSVVIGGVLLVIAFLVLLFGILADLIAKNRRLTEELLFRIKSYELGRTFRD
jgi:glycosyltransferase involved in cell wall biosynthesis